MNTFCGECKENCTPILIDDGIGSYEYWGAKGVDTRISCISACCEADVFKDPECTILYTEWDLKADVAADKYERSKDDNSYF
jgi:hypothetical protein